MEFDLPWWDANCEVIYFSWEDEVGRVVNNERCTFYRAYTLKSVIYVLFSFVFQDAMVDQVPDVHRSWIKKLFGFTVLKPTERSATTLGHKCWFMARVFRLHLAE